MSSRSITAPDTASSGQRAVNLLAIASPYLVAIALFLGLWLTRPAAPPPVERAAPPPPGGGPSVVADAHDTTPGPAQSDSTESPAHHAKSPAPPSPAHLQLDPGSGMRPGLSSQPSSAQPVSVDPVIAGTMKLSGAPLEYPAIARAARIEGSVVVAFIVGPDGSIRDARALSGPVLLQAAAVAAIRSWRYRPWRVEGHAVPFQSQVTIDFKINSAAPGS